MIRLKHIILRLLLVVIPVLMAMAQTMAQNNVYTGQTTTLSVVEIPGDTYSWELYNEVTGVNFAAVPGNCPASEAFFSSGNSLGSTVNVTWLKPGVYFYKVTASRARCTMNLKVGKITVLEFLPTATLLQPSPICLGEQATLNITLTGTAPWSIDVFDGITTTTYTDINASPFILNVSPLANTVYSVTRVSDAYGSNNLASNSVLVTVNPKPGSSHIYQYTPGDKKK